MSLLRAAVSFLALAFISLPTVSFAQAGFTAELAHRIPMPGSQCDIHVLKYYDTGKADPVTGKYKGFFLLPGDGWRSVSHWGKVVEDVGAPGVQVGDLFTPVVGTGAGYVWLDELTNAGYIVYAPEYRGWEDKGVNQNGVPNLIDPDCLPITSDEMLVELSLTLQLVGWNGVPNGDVDASKGWMLGGFSAGGHLAAWLSRNIGLPYAGVMTVDSPINLWDYWASLNGTRGQGLAETRTYTVPDNTGQVSFTLASDPAGAAFWIGGVAAAIQEYFYTSAPNCDIALNQGSDCFTQHHDLPGGDGWLSENSFVAATSDNDPPIFMVGDTGDPIVPPDAVSSSCETFGPLDFVQKVTSGVNGLGAPVDYYVYDCGTTDNRFLLLDTVFHIPTAETIDFFIDWAAGIH